MKINQKTQTFVEEIKRVLLNIPAAPVAFQAMWYSDIDYMSLDFEVVVENEKSYVSHNLESLEPRFDGQYEDGKTVVLSSEILIAKELGAFFSNKYNVPFYFPCPNNSRDDACPNWWEQDKGINCEDCGKLVILSDSPYLSKEVCYSCHIDRKSNDRIRNNELAFGEDGFNLFRYKDNEVEMLQYCSHLEMSVVGKFVKDELKCSIRDTPVNIITLEKADLEKLRIYIEQQLDERFAKYEKAEYPDQFYQLMYPVTVNYKGKSYELSIRIKHKVLYNLFCRYESCVETIENNYTYILYFKNGMTAQESTLLGFVNKKNGLSNISKAIKKYSNLMTETEIETALFRLQEMDCITFKNEEITITEKGGRINFVFKK